jgi:signal peptidase I
MRTNKLVITAMATTLLTLILIGLTLVITSPLATAASSLSPHSHIQPNQLVVGDSSVILDIENVRYSHVADTGSMEPTLYTGVQVLEKQISSVHDVSVGDIITYELSGRLIIHRIVEIGNDSLGYYLKTKGDSNPSVDKEKVRESQLRGVVVAILY